MVDTTVKDNFFKYIVDGDAFYTGILTVPLKLINAQGLDDLTGCTITAAFRDDPAGTPVVITATIEDAGARTISAKMDPFDSAMALGALANDLDKKWYLDIQIKKTSGSIIITVARYICKVIWQRDEAV